MASANSNTSLDPAVANKVASDHRETAGNVDAEKTKFNNAVDLMDDYCDGAMMRALINARDNWTAEVTRIVADFNEMAGNVDGTVQDFGQQDQDNAGQLGSVGSGIFADI